MEILCYNQDVCIHREVCCGLVDEAYLSIVCGIIVFLQMGQFIPMKHLLDDEHDEYREYI